ncbi:uncharacterized protein LOC122246996 isoform X5 [Penaeus japonicus]|uniref:uncharacterized protein LOC122246996 isoform X5 n=1 Tax=Penaeus japonicus TaxID=27405 RepID=UPI001C7109A6|nr:uncharacterized protein LOC122246996 isoform X5 [Penaeus japonicus]
MASKQLLILSVVVASVAAAPQFFADDQLPIPHDFAYGVEVADTGDAKEHKQSVSPSGRTEGEYRWLLPNGLFNVVRYYVDGDSGFQAQVSEEPGPAVGNYYTNSLSQESASGVVSSTNQGFARSFNLQPNVGRTVDVISAPRPSQVSFTSAPRPNQVSFTSAPRPNQVSFTSAPRPNQVSFTSAPRPNQVSFTSSPTPNQISFTSAPRPNQVSFTSAPRSNQVFSSVPAFNVQQQDSGGVIDGGFIDGGIIDGGIIDGGIIDDSVVSEGFSSNFDNSFENSAVILARNNRFRG